jgi:transcriptional regulator with XRE-family HTH domain
MGHRRRPQPKKLKSKLRGVRASLGITQEEMANLLKRNNAESSLHSGYIADYESGKREPSLLALLAYAKIAQISTDVLINDKLDLHRDSLHREVGKRKKR